MKKALLAVLAVTAAAAAVQPASAAITWTDWTQSGANQVVGAAGAVGVTFTGSYSFAQLTPGVDYYNGSGFPVGLKPSNTDIIALADGGTKTLTFSTAVSDVYLAIVSWNGNSAMFDSPFTIEAMGCGYWGCGTITQFNGGLSFSSDLYPNEPHGVLKFAGPITSLTFIDGSENWHGITVGFGAVAGVPEPASWAMMIGGFAIAGAAMRRRKAAVSFA